MAAGAFLTEDILIVIFTYLPLTSIYKFKAVSKVWLSILSDTYFLTEWFQINITNKSHPWMHHHTRINPNGLKKLHPLKLGNYTCPGLYSKSMSTLFDHGFSFQFLTDSKQIQGLELAFVGSSNGLVLCYTTLNHRRRYYVCNPLTQKWVSIPSPPNPFWCHFGVIGFFSEYSSSYTTSCYKVVRIAGLSSVKVWADIFCSKSGEWNSFEVSCPVNVSMERLWYDTVVTHDGVRINKGHKIVACILNNFRTDGYQCRIIDFPDVDGANARDRNLGESDGLICYARITNQRTLSAWVLKEDNWQSLYGIELRDIIVEMDFKKQNANSRWGSAEVLIQVVGFNPLDQDVVLLGCWNYVWEFNIRTRRFEELRCPCLFLSDSTSNDPLMKTPFVLKPMPTILPPLF
ncbi:putative F-box/kelch-repeat protein At4g22430 [Papaver somniferum]|uniref:putative F-box/kelch-repeat protein At4g22430 n=1 Tax=Papaver somniferum TaxID=3469 RepID=UPI000E6F546B|nr:putative F-box/kelch-repeat protein At4g22430 [Papaver somniferum]